MSISAETRIKEINQEILNLQLERQKLSNWKINYQKFHLNRIEDILFKGIVKTPQSQESYSLITLETTKEKLDWLISSLYEMGIIDSFVIEQQIEKNIYAFFKS